MKISHDLDNHLHSSCDPQTLAHEFARLAIRYSEFGKKAGVEILPFRNADLPLFRSKTFEKQKEVLGILARRVQIFDQLSSEGGSMKDSPRLIWQAMKALGFRPPSNYFHHITDDSVVEIHGPDGIQVFCNFNFYRYCSYSIEELFSDTWDRLFTRDDVFTAKIIQIVQRFYSGEITETISSGLPVQIVKELYSEYLNELELNMLWVSPLFREQTMTPVATSAIESARLVGTQGRQRSVSAQLRDALDILHL
jgi:hypothetical protein